MQPHSNHRIRSLSNSLTYNIVIDIFNGTQLSAELVLITVEVDAWVLRILILFNMISQVGIIIILFTLLFICLLRFFGTSSGWGDDATLLAILELSVIAIHVFIVALAISKVRHSIPSHIC